MPTSHIVEQPAELLAYLCAHWPDVKRGTIRQWLKYGSVQINGTPTSRSNHPLQAGDVISIRSKREALDQAQTPLAIVFEDPSLIVIDKPAGLLSMASETERRKTAYALLTDYVRRGDRHASHRVWIVHRLDRAASGLMVFAKTDQAKHRLQSNWSHADKRYLAVVEGAPSPDQGTLVSDLDETGPYKVYSAVPSKHTRRAVTHYRVIKRGGTYALLELRLETGRRNQIRVQLADARCPIVGDDKYGAKTDPARRLGLHGCSLQFAHPISGEPLRFESPLPRELAQLV